MNKLDDGETQTWALGSPRRQCEDNIRTDYGKISCEDVRWI
jgi:hypothetical protein